MAQDDMTKYKDTFLSEAKEHVASMNTFLLKLEKSPQSIDLVSRIFREIHTLKSMSAAMKYDNLVRACHAIEDILDALKKRKIKTESCIDTLFECFDTMDESLKNISKNREEIDTDNLIQKLQILISGEKELKVADKKEVVKDENAEAQKITSIEVKVEKLDLLMNLTEELLINKMRLDRIKEDLRNPELTAAVDILGRLVTDIQYNVMQSRMVPVSFVFNRFPRLVRDLAKSQKKDVNLEMEGTDIELDRGVIDEIGESLIHLIRNAIDHGLETPDVRKKLGKSSQGTIRLTAKRTKGLAVIEVSDDGSGLDIVEIKNKAVRKGIISTDATDNEIMNSIFSGVSTTKQVTQISGRGFGVNIVKEKIESVGGSINVESRLKIGTTFTIEIPLTLAIIKSLFVGVGGKIYAIPLVNIARLVTVNREDIKGMLNYEAIVLNEEDIPITRLDQLFGEPQSEHERQSIVIIRKGEEELGLAVDSFMSTQEIVIKPLNKVVKENKYFAGSTIIGSGEVVLILDVTNLMLTKREMVPTV